MCHSLKCLHLTLKVIYIYYTAATLATKFIKQSTNLNKVFLGISKLNIITLVQL